MARKSLLSGELGRLEYARVNKLMASAEDTAFGGAPEIIGTKARRRPEGLRCETRCGGVGRKSEGGLIFLFPGWLDRMSGQLGS
jgi:hypothetical protein